MEHQRIPILSLLLVIAIGASLSDSPAYGQSAVSCEWKQIGNTTSSHDMRLRAGAVKSAHRMWAVGDRSGPNDGDGRAAIRAWDGSSWEDESSTDLLWSQLNDVDLAPNALPIAVGSYVKQGTASGPGQQWSRALALHRKPGTIVDTFSDTQWEASPLPRSELPHDWLTGVSAVSGDQAWAVGQAYEVKGRSEVLIYRWDGTSWKRSRPRLDGSLLWDVEASAPDDVWAVGTTRNRDGVGRTLTFHFDGSRWRRISSPNHNRMKFHTLLGVGVRSKSDAWAVGYRHARGTSIIPIALRWNGTRWRLAKELPRISRREGAELYDVVPLEDEVIAVGSNGSFSNPRPLLWRRTSEGWAWVQTPEGENGHMDDIKVGTDGSLLAVGGGVFWPRPDEELAQYREYILFRPPC